MVYQGDMEIFITKIKCPCLILNVSGMEGYNPNSKSMDDNLSFLKTTSRRLDGGDLYQTLV